MEMVGKSCVWKVDLILRGQTRKIKYNLFKFRLEALLFNLRQRRNKTGGKQSFTHHLLNAALMKQWKRR